MCRPAIFLLLPVCFAACDLFDNPREDCPDAYARYVRVERTDLSSGFTGYIRGWWTPAGRCPNPNEKIIQLAVDTGSGALLVTGINDQFPYAIDTVEVFIQRTEGFGVFVVKWGVYTPEWDTVQAGVRVYHKIKSPPPM